MAISVTIGGGWNRATRTVTGGTDVSAFLDYSRLGVVHSIRDMGGSLSFDMVMESNNPAVPKAGNLAQLIENVGATSELVHAGPIRRVTNSMVVPDGGSGVSVLRYQVECSDWTPWLDKRPVVGVYGSNLGSAAGTILKQIIDDPSDHGPRICTKDFRADAYDFGYTPVGGGSTVETGLTVPLQTIEYQPFTAVIGELARATGYVWYVSADRLIHFFSKVNGSPSPLLFANGAVGDGVLDLDNDIVSYADCVITEDVSQVITRVILTNSNLKQAIPMATTPVTTGTNSTFFPLGFIPSNDTSTVGDFQVNVWGPGTPTTATPTKVYNAASNNLRLEYVDGSPNDAAAGVAVPDVCYICQSNVGFRLGQAPPPGSNVAANFKFFMQTNVDRYGPSLSAGFTGVFWPNPPYNNVVSSATDDGTGMPISDIGVRESSDGIYTRVISDPTLMMSTANVGTQKCDQWLWRFANTMHLVRFESLVPGWKAGQKFTLQSASRNFAAETMYVQQVALRPYFDDTVGDWRLRATVECSNNPWGGS